MNEQPDSRLDRQKIAQRFCRAYDSYQKAAVVQSQVCDELLDMLTLCTPMDFSHVLEVGCGSGLLTQKFLGHCQPKSLYLNDLYPKITENQLNINPSRRHHLIGDITKLSLDRPLDLILSTSALQWVYPLGGLIDKFYQALTTGGYLAFSSFLVGNLHQIKSLTGQGLTYYDQAGLKDVLVRCGFEILQLRYEEKTLYFPSSYAVLKHLQATGVTGGGHFRWTKKTLAEFDAGYQRFASQQGFALTYCPVLVIARKNI